MSLTLPRSKLVWRWSSVAAGFVILGLALKWSLGRSEQQLLEAAARAAEQRDLRRAAGLCEQVLTRNPHSAAGLKIAADVAEQEGRKAHALQFLQQLSRLPNGESADVLSRSARLALELGRLTDGENFLRHTLALQPDHPVARQQLVQLLRVEGRNWEALPSIRDLLAAGQASVDLLFVVGSTEWIWLDTRQDQPILQHAHSSVPNDPVPLLGKAIDSLLREQISEAFPLLLQIVQARPDLLEAQSRLGLLLVRSGGAAEFVRWHASLPKNADEHPGIWFVRGLWLRDQGETLAAIRCFGEAVTRHPNHQGACYQLSQLLNSGATVTLAEKLADRASLLARVEDLLRELSSTPELAQELAESLESLGRWWEAYGWAQWALQRRNGSTWADALIARITPRLNRDLPLTVTAALPFDRSTWQTYPLPIWDEVFKSAGKPPRPLSDEESTTITFADRAAAAGIDFRYDNGADPSVGRAYMFEFNGGGVAVLDFDRDGWPDVHLTQAGRWSLRGDPSNAIDRLFRNDGQGHFTDVTAAAGVFESSFSQGVTSGDFDNDGFPDLYVANIGQNRFFHNHGDGTFSEITEATGTAGDAWSLSAALADLNRDGLPDLYVVNYLGGSEVFERACTHNGRPVQCQPSSFPGEQDRLYLNLGDGRFQDVTQTSGIERPNGKGMGLVVADFDDSGTPDLFIANDTTANFLFLNETEPAGPLQFSERGVVSGVAFSNQGKPQSSMGVAVGDVNGDERLDLLVTNFIREASNLFIQLPGQLFEDRAPAAGVFEASINRMGWGAQFLDADGDGHLDLVVANGHLDDYSSDGVPFRMTTQCLRNRGDGRFDDVPPAKLGLYFSTPGLGRAIARLDWNRDGREDFGITHVDRPFGLLTNVTNSGGHRLTIRLSGTSSSRDAVGAVVRVNIGNRSLVRHVTAGDGFQASNERAVFVGLGNATQADSIHVRWPHGAEQTFPNLPADQEWLLIEGQPDAIRLRPRDSQ